MPIQLPRGWEEGLVLSRHCEAEILRVLREKGPEAARHASLMVANRMLTNLYAIVGYQAAMRSLQQTHDAVAALISGLSVPGSIAVSGSNLFVANFSADTIGEYTTSGKTVNAALITGLDGPSGIAVSGSDLFVTNTFGGTIGGGTIGEYTTAGATVNAALISGLSDPAGIAISGPIIPEASTWVMSLTGFAALAFVGFRRARSRAVSA
jgi:hypothetical protein